MIGELRTYCISVVGFAISEVYIHSKYIAVEVFAFFCCRWDIETEYIDWFITTDALNTPLQKQTI